MLQFLLSEAAEIFGQWLARALSSGAETIISITCRSMISSQRQLTSDHPIWTTYLLHEPGLDLWSRIGCDCCI